MLARSPYVNTYYIRTYNTWDTNCRLKNLIEEEQITRIDLESLRHLFMQYAIPTSFFISYQLGTLMKRSHY